MNFIRTEIADVVIIAPKLHETDDLFEYGVNYYD